MNHISLEEIICAGRYITDALMNMPDFLLKGVIILLDCNGASINQARHFTIPTVAKFINVFWVIKNILNAETFYLMTINAM